MAIQTIHFTHSPNPSTNTPNSSNLRLWHNITPLPHPLIPPSSTNTKSKHIIVVGAGVIGLTISWALLDRGYQVTVISKDWPSSSSSSTIHERLASQVGGAAMWSYPHSSSSSTTHNHREKRWSTDSYRIWSDIALAAAGGGGKKSNLSGVTMLPSSHYFPHRIEENQIELTRMNEIRDTGVFGFTRGGEKEQNRLLVNQNDLYPAYITMDSYTFLVPHFTTHETLSYLLFLIKSKGAHLHTHRIEGDLFVQELDLRRKWNADAIVNCTGIGSVELAGDHSCYPNRGGFINVINDGISFPQIKHGLTVHLGNGRKKGGVVVVPRTNGTLLVGASSEPDNWHLNLTLDSPVIQRLKSRCEAHLPFLKNARIDPSQPISQGLRPSRQGNEARVERESREVFQYEKTRVRSMIIHSYGHGEAGWTVSWGCAGDVVRLVDELFGV
ncbi:hypothetical protein AAF712_011951 [Marasmius tenuissimus]|uniref:FAD dependent oxidoreductase domain-containing protein n=1 Tax=Marasmius tenuissimus TaxID=585030 RepID=A0ABR2ZHX2_9AGAR